MNLPEARQITGGDVLKPLVLLAIPAVLAVIYFGTSTGFQQSLALDHTNPRLHNFWTNALVHNHRPDDGHLTGNIVVYLALVFPAWILQIYREQEHRFWTALVIILVFGPFLFSASSYIAFYEIIGLELQNDRGFSGVVGALAGFLLTSILHTFSENQEEPVAILSTGLYFGFLILGLGAMTGRLLAVVAGAVVIIGMTAATRIHNVATFRELFEWVRENGELSLVLVAAIFLSIVGFAGALPTDIVTDGGVRNIVAHGAGLIFGMALAGWFQYYSRRSTAEGPAAA